MKKFLFFGCGKLGLKIANILKKKGNEVHAIVKNKSRASFIELEYKIPSIACDLTSCTSLQDLVKKNFHEKFSNYYSILISLSTKGGTATSYQKIYEDAVSNVLTSFSPQKIIFCSSSSIYRHKCSELVSEETKISEFSEKSFYLYKAEQNLRSTNNSIILRIAGLYDNKWRTLQNFLSGKAKLEKGGVKFLNFIHYDDASKVIAYFLQNAQKHSPSTWNLSDNHPITQKELYSIFSKTFNQPIPKKVGDYLTSSRGFTNKRVDSSKLLEIPIPFTYPTLNHFLQVKSSDFEKDLLENMDQDS